MSNGQGYDEDKGEFRNLGKRHALIDVQGLCDHLDSLVGVSVAEVIIHNHQVRLGKEDAEALRKERPQATTMEIINIMAETERRSGIGVVSVTIPDDLSQPISVQILNPCVKSTRGAAKSFLLSYWTGALSQLLGKELDIRNVTADDAQNLLKCQISRRQT